MQVSEFIMENILLFIIAATPLLYFIIRDIVSYFREKSNLKESKKALIESEKRIYELLKKSDQNKADLVNQVRQMKSQVHKAILQTDEVLKKDNQSLNKTHQKKMTNNKNKADDIYNKFKLDKKKLKELLEHEDAIQNTQKYLTSLLKEVTAPIPPLEKRLNLKNQQKTLIP